MILKVQGTKYPVKNRDRIDWWVFDDISNVHWYNRLPYVVLSESSPLTPTSDEVEELACLSKYSPEIYVLFDGERIGLDYTFIDGVMKEIEDKEVYGYCTYITCYMRNGSIKTIAFDGKGFLMNDEGKTIERF